MRSVLNRFQNYLIATSSPSIQRLAYCTESQAKLGSEKDSKDTSTEKPLGGGRKRNRMKIMERVGVTPAAQSLLQGRKWHRKPMYKPPATSQDGSMKSEEVDELIEVPTDIHGDVEDGFIGKGVPLNKEQIMKLLGQLDADESSKTGSVEDEPQILDSEDPSIDYMEVVSEIRAFSSHKTTVKWLGKRKTVTMREMEGVDCSRDYDFARGAFESPNQAKFKKRGDPES